MRPVGFPAWYKTLLATRLRLKIIGTYAYDVSAYSSEMVYYFDSVLELCDTNGSIRLRPTGHAHTDIVGKPGRTQECLKTSLRRACEITCHRIRNRAPISRSCSTQFEKKSVDSLRIEYEPTTKLMFLSIRDVDKRSYNQST